MIFSPRSITDRLSELWEAGLPPGFKTGWPSVDKHYTVLPGQLTIVTGWPGSGKSEWVDALAVNLIKDKWGFAIFSPENQPYELHLAKLCEKLVGKPFGHGPSERLNKQDLEDSLAYFQKRVGFIKGSDGIDIAQILSDAGEWFKDYKFFTENKGLVIDPWNEIEHSRPNGVSETEYISQSLSKLRNWAREQNAHVWLVAHPQKLQRDKETGKLPVPRPDSISGSQNWWNKADVAITIHRDMGDDPKQDVDVHIWKVRFKHIGMPGKVTLKYDRTTGRYHELLRVIDGKARAAGEEHVNF
jgi:twinkle protein